MNITLNGSIFIGGEEVYLEDFEVEINKELDLPFDYLTDDEEDYCDGDCDYCEFCEDEDELQDDFNNNLDALLDEYVELFMERHICPECVRDLLLDMLNDFINM